MTMLMEPFTPSLRELNRYFAGGGTATAPGFLPPADVVVTDDAVMVQMDVPGLSQEDLEIELENDVLTIRGERRFPYEAGDERTWQRIERPFGRFERVLRVPRGLDPSAVEASLVNGVLTLRIRKPEPLKPHRIEVRAEEGGQQQPQVTQQGQPQGMQQGQSQGMQQGQSQGMQQGQSQGMEGQAQGQGVQEGRPPQEAQRQAAQDVGGTSDV
jgi:HSP20 family protein